MKCEICHKAEAKAVIHRPKKDGSTEELYVCKTCAQAAKAEEAKGQDAPDEGGEGSEGHVVFGASGEKPPPFVENLLKATLGFVQGIAEAEAEKSRPEACPLCGKKREALVEDGRPGCPECWHSFNVEIRDRLLGGQYGVRHKGRVPANVANPAATDPADELERRLKTAVKNQQFEKAAQIRSELEKLGRRPKRGKPEEDGR